MSSTGRHTIQINVRATLKEKEVLHEMAAAQNISVSELLLRPIFGARELSKRIPLQLVPQMEKLMSEYDEKG